MIFVMPYTGTSLFATNVHTGLQINGSSHPDSLAETISFHANSEREEGFRKTKGLRETFYNISNMSNDISACTLKSTGDT